MSDEKKIYHYRDENVVLYLRGKWFHARFKLPDGKWRRISTKKKDLAEASVVACDKYDEIKFREKNNMSGSTPNLRTLQNSL